MIHLETDADAHQAEVIYDEQGNANAEDAAEDAQFEDDEENFDDFDFEESTEDTLEGLSFIQSEIIIPLTHRLDTNEDLSATLNTNEIVHINRDKVDSREATAEQSLLTPSADELGQSFRPFAPFYIAHSSLS